MTIKGDTAKQANEWHIHALITQPPQQECIRNCK